MSVQTLRIASCMAENTDELCRSIVNIIESEVGIPTEYVTEVPWQERERLFDLGEIQILWLCGLPYVNKADLADSRMELLAVPVPAGARYQARPVYFSDVVVRRESVFESFVDLRGASWAYNEPRSHSGFNVVRAYLAEIGELEGFFGSVIESGAHTNSIELILSGVIDGAAIDSTVLEWLSVPARRSGRPTARYRYHRPEPDPALGHLHEIAWELALSSAPAVAQSTIEPTRAGRPRTRTACEI